MSILDSLLVAAFCWALVFTVLACLFGLIRLFSLILGNIAPKKEENPINVPAATVTASAPIEDEPYFSTGDLRLKGVDERTAAMIMAIVSDESGIPLSELCFKSIKEIPQQNI